MAGAACRSPAPGKPSVAQAKHAVPAASLLPSTATGEGPFALQAGRFANAAAADAWAARVQHEGFSTTVGPVVDGSGTTWWVVAVGRFSSLAEARALRVRLGTLGEVSSWPLIVLPAEW